MSLGTHECVWWTEWDAYLFVWGFFCGDDLKWVSQINKNQIHLHLLQAIYPCYRVTERAISRWRDMAASRSGGLRAGRTNHIMPAWGCVVTLVRFFNVVRNTSAGNKKYRSHSFHTGIHYPCMKSRSKAAISERKVAWFDYLLWLCALSGSHRGFRRVRWI